MSQQVPVSLYESPAGDEHSWTPDRLRRVLHSELEGRRLVIASNRQPYSHEKLEEGRIAVRTSAGGVVTVLSPVMRACSGVWVAHGSGSADRDIVDTDDRVRVPPESPAYVLRRVWLSAEERKQYYEGFSNEGLWPLCHTTPLQPKFRRIEWLAYKHVNRRFADAVLDECRGARALIFVQDYHLALLPRLLREAAPESTIVLFWHVPWPSPDRLALCPWWRVIVQHMVDADIIGFNTHEHCGDFLSAVGRLEGFRMDKSSGAACVGTHVCRVSPYPDSIEWAPRHLDESSTSERARAEVCGRFGIAAAVSLGLSVDRCDPTKGILQRLRAVERLLEDSRWRGAFTLLQVAVPSRSNILAYRELLQMTSKEVERINSRFATADWKPVVWVQEEQNREHLHTLYRSADVCLVNSLHDGMNLVAKEFVASRDDEDGVLILSKRAGAAHELVEALLIDPLDIFGTAAAIEVALSMSRNQRRARMRSMRKTVEHHNVYRWAGHILRDAAKAKRVNLNGDPV